jgi:hypothetical protein
MKVVVIMAMLMVGSVAEAKTIRATEMTGSLWSKLTSGLAEELTVEFRQGDELPVTFVAEGDLLETSRGGVSYVAVKRNFWIQLRGNEVRMSLDGVAFKPIKEMIGGSFTVGSDADQNGGIANAIQLGLKAKLK